MTSWAEYTIERLKEERAIGPKTASALGEAGIRTLLDLAFCSYQELGALKGVGPVALDEIKRVMISFGMREDPNFQRPPPITPKSITEIVQKPKQKKKSVNPNAQRKKGQIAMNLETAVTNFITQIESGVKLNLPLFRERTGAAKKITDQILFNEMFAAGLAIGIQSTRNIWDTQTFERACEILLTQLKIRATFGIQLQNILTAYLGAWSDANPGEGGNLPIHDVAGLAVTRVGNNPSSDEFVDPFAIMGTSEGLLLIQSMFWKTIESQVDLSDSGNVAKMARHTNRVDAPMQTHPSWSSFLGVTALSLLIFLLISLALGFLIAAVA